MAASKPASIAIEKKEEEISGRCGNPKEILLTPRTVESPSFCLTRRMARRVSAARFCSALTVSVRQSMMMSESGIPRRRAAFLMRLAMASRPSAVSGIPFLSSASPMTAAPYFLASGSIFLRLLASPETELINTLPSAALRPASRAAGLDESSTSGALATPLTQNTARSIAGASLMPGAPTLTSRSVAPACSCSIASRRI